MFEKSKFLQERKNNNYNTDKPTLTLEYESKCNVKHFKNQWERRFQQQQTDPVAILAGMPSDSFIRAYS